MPYRMINKSDLTKGATVYLTAKGVGEANRRMRATAEMLGETDYPQYNEFAIFFITDLLIDKWDTRYENFVAVRYPDRKMSFSIALSEIASVV